MKKSILCLTCVLIFGSFSLSAQSLQQLILSDSSKAILPDSVKNIMKGEWQWTNGKDSLNIYFIENTFDDNVKYFEAPDLCALLGYWYYYRYNSIRLGSKLLKYDKDNVKNSNFSNIVVSSIWDKTAQLVSISFNLQQESTRSIHCKLKLIDSTSALLLFDGFAGERSFFIKNDLFNEYYLPTNIVLKKVGHAVNPKP
ncbi:MAG: hypothetical protein CUR34_07140 [Sediminibacterium sp.]|jgi:hypothetical protein|nr:MAG: hypothetical protein CUR34_07140 [Sediminibacterium sp.] [Sediminibacterium sp. FEMGT703S]